MRIDGKVFDTSPASTEPSAIHFAATSSRKSDLIVKGLVRIENSLNKGSIKSVYTSGSLIIDTHDLSRRGMRSQRMCSMFECRTMEALSPSASTAA